MSKITKVLRTYRSMDGVGSQSEFEFSLSSEEFDRLREEFRTFAASAGGAENLPRVEEKDSLDVWHGFYGNCQWSAFCKWLLQRDVSIVRTRYAELGNERRVRTSNASVVPQAAMDHNAAMTREDVQNQGHMELAEGVGHYHVVIEDNAAHRNYAPV